MACAICKQEKELRIDTEIVKVCKDCYVKHDNHREIELINDVLFYLREHSRHAPRDTIRDKCATNYSEDEILEAKKYLIDNVSDAIMKIDAGMTKELIKNRQNSLLRSKVIATIHDMYNILDMLPTTIIVSAENMEKISMINPEALLPDAVVQRLVSIEDEMSVIKQENAIIKQENDNLKTELTKLTTLVTSPQAGGGAGPTQPNVPPKALPRSKINGRRNIRGLGFNGRSSG